MAIKIFDIFIMVFKSGVHRYLIIIKNKRDWYCSKEENDEADKMATKAQKSRTETKAGIKKSLICPFFKMANNIFADDYFVTVSRRKDNFKLVIVLLLNFYY